MRKIRFKEFTNNVLQDLLRRAKTSVGGYATTYIEQDGIRKILLADKNGKVTEFKEGNYYVIK